MPVIRFAVGDTLELKKKHPCGSALFRVEQTGSLPTITCLGCRHTLTIDRIKLEKSIKKILPTPSP
ncbi:MAG: DUF951 domain-containing protein [Eubacteriales bacterium]